MRCGITRNALSRASYFNRIILKAHGNQSYLYMRVELSRIIAMCAIVVGLSACSTSTGLINTPIGKIQLGMYIEDVGDILGEGSVLVPERAEGEFLVQTRVYPAQDGRRFVVYYVNDIVRRWELQDRPSTAAEAR